MTEPMRVRFDPAHGIRFWEAVQALPGYPRADEIRLRRMVFEADALQALPEVLGSAGARRSESLFVVTDSTPMRRGNDDLKPLVLATLQRAGWRAETIVLEPDVAGQLHTDFAQIGRVQSRLTRGCAVLSVGSGTVTDIAKHACHRFEQGTGATLPYVVYQTANSVSAFTSNMAPTVVEGVKRTLPSRYPDALVCDLKTLRDAPYAMTAAGVGDLLAASVSFADWYLAHALGLDDTYAPLAETLMESLEEALLMLAPRVRAQDLGAMGELARLIALAGLAMSLSHVTTPLSGYEHVISHVLDMTAEASKRPAAIHGAQVGLAALRMTSVYSDFLKEAGALGTPPEPADPTIAHARVADAFALIDPSGRAGEECWREYTVKLEAWRERRAQTTTWAEWPGIRAELSRRVWSLQTVRGVIRSVGLPSKFEDLEPPIPEANARQAFLSAHWIRRRFTVGDLLFLLGWDRDALWDRAAKLTSMPA